MWKDDKDQEQPSTLGNVMQNWPSDSFGFLKTQNCRKGKKSSVIHSSQASTSTKTAYEASSEGGTIRSLACPTDTSQATLASATSTLSECFATSPMDTLIMDSFKQMEDLLAYLSS